MVVIYRDQDYLMHHGIKGQKWGVRRFQNEDGTWKAGVTSTERLKSNYKRAESDLKSARAKYGESFNKASSYSDRHPITQHIGGHKKVADAYWKEAASDGEKVNKARQNARDARLMYKAGKARDKARDKAEIKALTKELNRTASRAEKLTFNNATRKKAASFMVKNNMTYEEAKKKSQDIAIRNTALMLGAYGGLMLVDLYKNRH